jgi:hypothetical protein
MTKHRYTIVAKDLIPETLVTRISFIHARALWLSNKQVTEEPGESTPKARVNSRDCPLDRKRKNATPKPKRNGLNE